jgi:predicted transcriptional regulator
MSGEKLKEYLHQIAENVKPETQLNDVYEQLALLTDIDESEEQEKLGKVITHEEVVTRSEEWLK